MRFASVGDNDGGSQRWRCSYAPTAMEQTRQRRLPGPPARSSWGWTTAYQCRATARASVAAVDGIAIPLQRETGSGRVGRVRYYQHPKMRRSGLTGRRGTGQRARPRGGSSDNGLGSTPPSADGLSWTEAIPVSGEYEDRGSR